MADTNIPVSDEVWSELNSRKQRGDTFDDVLRRVLDMNGGAGDDVIDTPDIAIDSGGRAEESEASVELPEDLPSTVDPADARAAIEAAVDYLEREGGATMREIVRDVMPGHPLGYDVPELGDGERFRGAWWRRVVKPALELHDSVEKPPRGRSEWCWVG